MIPVFILAYAGAIENNLIDFPSIYFMFLLAGFLFVGYHFLLKLKKAEEPL